MIVDNTRLVTSGGADSSAPVADSVLADSLAPTQPSSGNDTTSGDFAASFGRSTAQALDSLGQEGDVDAGHVAPELVPEMASVTVTGTEVLARPDVAPFIGSPVVPVTPTITLGNEDLPVADGAASTPGNVQVLPAAVTPVAGDSVFVAQDRPATGNESPRDTVSPHIATLLAAHEHRMRGALGSEASAQAHQPKAGDVDTSASSPVPAGRASAAVAPTPIGALPLGRMTLSPIAHPTVVDPANQRTASVDSAAAPGLRTSFAPATLGNAFAVDPSTAAVSSGYFSTNATADGTTLTRALSERIHTMTDKGVHEARLRLTPAELGDIAIVVRKSPMQLSVSLQVARPEALSLVQGTAALLRDMLSQRHAGDVHVSVSGLPSYGGDGASGDARERHSRDDPSRDAGPGLALGEADRERRAFPL